jgi:hypothetical protein
MKNINDGKEQMGRREIIGGIEHAGKKRWERIGEKYSEGNICSCVKH